MSQRYNERLKEILIKQDRSKIHVYTLGRFEVIRSGETLSSKSWGRDKTLQLFQFLISHRSRHAMHKEQIMDRLWEDANDRDFKVAMHGINKALEPDRPARTDPTYIIRQGLTYQLNLNAVWLDVEIIDSLIILANEAYHTDQNIAIQAYRKAQEYDKGAYLPNRMYEDWSSEERERIQVLILGAYISLAELTLDRLPMESIRLTQKALQIDPCWEDAYRIQMKAYISNGNRPQALKTYQTCQDILDREYGIDPLPATQNLLKEISGKKS